jgi:hypothetical protein
MEPIISIVLSSAAKTLVSKLVGKITNDLYDKIKGDPAQKAIKKAIGAAIERYANRNHIGLVLAQPLMKKKGLLTHPDVAAELAEIVRFQREPDFQLIGQRWKEAVDHPQQGYNFYEEAKILVEYVEKELRGTEVFRSVFDAKSIDAIAASAEESAESLGNIEKKLEGLTALFDARFGQLADTFAGVSSGIRDQIYDFTSYIEEKTRSFVGRRWIFDAIDKFMSKNRRGYFFLIGDPGIGKSALSAQMIKQNGYVHHFNIRAEGISKAATFLKNVSAQLIATYRLPYTVLLPETTDNAGVFKKLLSEVSDKLKHNERCVIVVDALDEADMKESGNLLYLPLELPKGVYIVVTMRDDPNIKPRVDCEESELQIKHDSSDNLSDVADFLEAATVRPRIQAHITARKIKTRQFIALMVQKSEGNFMYLRHVLPEIESGAYKDLNLEMIPTGLQNYYEDHWRRMKGQDQEAWFKYKLPVIVALTAAREPVSLDLISDFSNVESKPRIRAVLQEWRQFLHEEYIEYRSGLQRRYRLYHASFFDFIATKQQVVDERVDLQEMHGQIADSLWNGVFGNE